MWLGQEKVKNIICGLKCPPCQELAVKKKNLTEVEEMVH